MRAPKIDNHGGYAVCDKLGIPREALIPGGVYKAQTKHDGECFVTVLSLTGGHKTDGKWRAIVAHPAMGDVVVTSEHSNIDALNLICAPRVK